MSTDNETPHIPNPDRPALSAPSTPPRRRMRPFAAAIALVLVGGVAGAGVTSLVRKSRAQDFTMVPQTSIAKLDGQGPVAVHGEVKDVFGNKFVVQDDTGRALIETGRSGEGRSLVKPGEAVAVRGRFENGFIHAAVITHDSTSRNDVLDVGPPRPPRPLAWAPPPPPMAPPADAPPPPR